MKTSLNVYLLINKQLLYYFKNEKLYYYFGKINKLKVTDIMVKHTQISF